MQNHPGGKDKSKLEADELSRAQKQQFHWVIAEVVGVEEAPPKNDWAFHRKRLQDNVAHRVSPLTSRLSTKHCPKDSFNSNGDKQRGFNLFLG